MSANRSSDRFENYVPVSERLEKFHERHAEGRIVTHIEHHDIEAGFVLMRAEVYRGPDDAQPAATGHAFEERSGGPAQKTNYIEVCETSAVGRALALLGFEVKRGIASREEMQKTARPEQRPDAQADPVQAQMETLRKQIKLIFRGATRAKQPDKTFTDEACDVLLSRWVGDQFNGAAPDELSLTELKAVLERMQK